MCSNSLVLVELLPQKNHMEVWLQNRIWYDVAPEPRLNQRIRLRVNLESTSSILKKKQLMGVA
jgi:hypothetical protein